MQEAGVRTVRIDEEPDGASSQPQSARQRTHESWNGLP